MEGVLTGPQMSIASVWKQISGSSALVDLRFMLAAVDLATTHDLQKIHDSRVQ